MTTERTFPPGHGTGAVAPGDLRRGVSRRRILVLSGFLLLASSPVLHGADGPARTALIVRAGATLSHPAVRPDDYDARLGAGPGGALLGDFFLFGPLHVVGGAGYETRGFRTSAEDGSRRLRADFLSVPVLVALQYPAGIAPAWRIFARGGVELDLLLASDFREAPSDFAHPDLADVLTRYELGTEIPFGPASLMLTGGRSRQLDDYRKRRTNGLFSGGTDVTWEHLATHVMVGIKMPVSF